MSSMLSKGTSRPVTHTTHHAGARSSREQRVKPYCSEFWLEFTSLRGERDPQSAFKKPSRFLFLVSPNIAFTSKGNSYFEIRERIAQQYSTENGELLSYHLLLIEGKESPTGENTFENGKRRKWHCVQYSFSFISGIRAALNKIPPSSSHVLCSCKSHYWESRRKSLFYAKGLSYFSLGL